MKCISFCRQIKVEDITELTPRRNTVTVNIKLNKPPQLEEVDNKIAELMDVLDILEQNLDSLEQDYFQDNLQLEESENSEQTELKEDDSGKIWNQNSLDQEYYEEIRDKDLQYEALLKKLTQSTI